MAMVDVDLKRALRLLQPGPVVLVTAQYRGKKNVMAAAWVAPISSDPPMVALAVFPGRFTHDLIQKSGDFALNIPPRPLVDKVKQVGEISGEDVDKFLQAGLTPYEAKQVNAPLIAECIGHLECGVIDSTRAGDHTLFLAQVVAAAAEASACNGEMWTLAGDEVKPLHHLGANAFAVLTSTLLV